MAKGRKTGGRKKGTPNKTTQAAKDAIALAAERLGGVDRLVAWAKEDPTNEKVFWGTIYTKLLPLQADINHDVSDGLSELMEYVAKNGSRLGD